MVLVALGLVGYFLYKPEITDYINEQKILSTYTYDKKTVSIVSGPKTLAKFEAEVADTNDKVQLGLSFRKSLGTDKAMLFTFANNVSGGFWMKDMKFNLDIIFVDANYKIIKIYRQLTPCTQDLSTCPNHAPGDPYRYVFEINGGLSEQFGISEGQKLVVSD
jgi:uncharacterized protein